MSLKENDERKKSTLSQNNNQSNSSIHTADQGLQTEYLFAVWSPTKILFQYAKLIMLFFSFLYVIPLDYTYKILLKRNLA